MSLSEEVVIDIRQWVFFVFFWRMVLQSIGHSTVWIRGILLLTIFHSFLLGVNGLAVFPRRWSPFAFGAVASVILLKPSGNVPCMHISFFVLLLGCLDASLHSGVSSSNHIGYQSNRLPKLQTRTSGRGLACNGLRYLLAHMRTPSQTSRPGLCRFW